MARTLIASTMAYREAVVVIAQADPNWLLSTVAQSSAALIAIVGGLLVSRYVALHAEQLSAQRRMDDLARRLTEAESHLSDAQRVLDLHYVDDLLDDDDIYDLILEDLSKPDLHTVLALAGDDGDGLNLTLLEERLTDLVHHMQAAVAALKPLVPRTTEHADWPKFRLEHDLTVEHRGAWERAYWRICDLRTAEAKEAARKERRSADPFGLGYIQALDVVPLRIPDLGGVTASQIAIAAEDGLRSRVDAADDDLRALRQERRLSAQTFEATRQPEGFELALRVLTTFAVLGLAVPVLIMGVSPSTLPLALRGLVVACFLGGVALLLRFLFVYASFLSEGSGRKELPTSVRSLLWNSRDASR